MCDRVRGRVNKAPFFLKNIYIYIYIFFASRYVPTSETSDLQEIEELEKMFCFQSFSCFTDGFIAIKVLNLHFLSLFFHWSFA